MRASGPAPSRCSSTSDSPQRFFVVGLGQRQGRLVGAVAGAPRSRPPPRQSPASWSDHGSVARRGDVVHDPALAPPVRELAEPPRRAASCSRSYAACVASRHAPRCAARAMPPRRGHRPGPHASPDRSPPRRSTPPRRAAERSRDRRAARARARARASSACSRGWGESRASATIKSRGRGRLRPVRRDRARAARGGTAGRAARGRARGPRSAPALPRSTARLLVRAVHRRPEREVGHGTSRRAAAAGSRGPRRAPRSSGCGVSSRNSSTVATVIDAVDPLLGVAEPARELDGSIPPREHGLVVAAVRGEKGHRAGRVGERTGSPAGARARRSNGWRRPRPRSRGLGTSDRARDGPVRRPPDRSSPLAGAARSPARARRSPRPGRP